MLQVCANIKLARDSTDKSQEDMAKLLGVKRTTYANWENNTEPNIETIKRIAQILGVTFNQLTDTPEKEDAPIEFKTNAALLNGSVQENLLAIKAQLKVLFAKIVEIESFDFKEKIKQVPKPLSSVHLDLANLIEQETERLLDALRKKQS